MARRRTDLAASLNAGTRDSKGKLRKIDNCYVEFVAGTRTVREATEFTNRTTPRSSSRSASRMRLQLEEERLPQRIRGARAPRAREQ